MTESVLRTRTAAEFASRRCAAVSHEALAAAAPIVEEVRRRGEPALRADAERFGELGPGEPLVIERASLEQALGSLARAAATRFPLPS